MASPYDKAIRHAIESARRGLDVEACGYKSPTWRSAWLKAFQEAQQMDFPLDDFDDDVKKAEEAFNANNNTESAISQPTDAPNGDTGIYSSELPETAGTGQADKRIELGLHSGISNADYHAGPGISSTSLKYANKAMRLYQAHITGEVKFKETEAMRLGTAVHALTLEAMSFGDEIIVSKKFGRTDKAKEEKSEFYAANPGKTIITADDYDKCRYMRDSLLELEDVEYIFSTGAPEQSGYYLDRDQYGNRTNMLCKYRPDWRNDECIFDIKSTNDITKEAFEGTINNFGYHISAAHYLEGDRITMGTNHRQFVFGCVEPEPPYLATTYVLKEESLELGEWLRRRALTGIKHGRDTEQWPGYNDGITTEIGVRPYALNDMKRSKI